MAIHIFLALYCLPLFLILIAGGFWHRKKALKSSSPKIKPEDITVVIPFRNEALNLVSILNSLRQCSCKPHRILFIDDHSEDESVRILREQMSELNFEIWELPQDIMGKKVAVNFGIKKANTPLILTMDADVVFPKDYFNHLSILPVADLWILPVILQGNTLTQIGQELDVNMANAFNVGLYGLFRPVMASGANLLFKRQAYLEMGIANHAHISSGDEMFLLRDFRQNNKDIRLYSSLKLAVFTPTERGLSAFINQRLRWLSKTKAVNDPLANFLGCLQMAFVMAYFVLLILFIIKCDWLSVGYLFLVKTGVEMLLYFPYFFRFKRFISWFYLPLYSLVLPFYGLVLLMGLFFYHPKWKGRPVKI